MIAYFDNSATTKPCASAVAAVTEALTDCWGNPSSLHTLGIAAERRLHQARQRVAQALGAETNRVYFTSGGTEADNWALFSAASRMKKQGKHIITTAVEHHAVLNPIKKLEEQGFSVTYLQPDALGQISVETLAAALQKDTVLVSVMMVNNETGAVMPIEKMAKLTHRQCPNALFHTDAVQGFLKIPFRAKALGADLISVSGHKIHAVKGVGALYVRERLSLPPFLLGGGQEAGYRSGTEPLPAIAAMGAACSEALPTLRQDLAEMTRLRQYLQQKLREMSGVVLLGAQQAPHIINLSVPGVRSQGLINCLQDQGVYVSAGSACAKGHRSHVLEASGVAPELIDGSIRVSLSRFTTQAEADQLLSALSSALTRLR